MPATITAQKKTIQPKATKAKTTRPKASGVKSRRPISPSELDLRRRVERLEKRVEQILKGNGHQPGPTYPERKRSHPPYLLASRAIRDEGSGRLDAKKIASLFDLSLRELAAALNLPNHQRLDQNPTGEGIQELLRPFEEISHCRIWFDGDDALFRQWLETPNSEIAEYEGKKLSPKEMIRLGHPGVVAHIVENMLTGHPA